MLVPKHTQAGRRRPARYSPRGRYVAAAGFIGGVLALLALGAPSGVGAGLMVLGLGLLPMASSAAAASDSCTVVRDVGGTGGHASRPARHLSCAARVHRTRPFSSTHCDAMPPATHEIGVAYTNTG